MKEKSLLFFHTSPLFSPLSHDNSPFSPSCASLFAPVALPAPAFLLPSHWASNRPCRIVSISSEARGGKGEEKNRKKGGAHESLARGKSRSVGHHCASALHLFIDRAPGGSHAEPVDAQRRARPAEGGTALSVWQHAPWPSAPSPRFPWRRARAA